MSPQDWRTVDLLVKKVHTLEDELREHGERIARLEQLTGEAP